jgi:hypothetical protein
MRANTKGKHGMGKRFAVLIGAAALGAAVIAVGASADFKSVNDPRGDTKCFDHDVPASGGHCTDWKRQADIVRATAGHNRVELKHTITVVGVAREGQGGALLINTDSDPGCEWSIDLLWPGEFISQIVPCAGQPNASTRCCAQVHRNDGTPGNPYSVHDVVITFKKGKIGSPRFYGWSAHVFAGPPKDPTARSTDAVPNRGYIRHRLG